MSIQLGTGERTEPADTKNEDLRLDWVSKRRTVDYKAIRSGAQCKDSGAQNQEDLTALENSSKHKKLKEVCSTIPVFLIVPEAVRSLFQSHCCQICLKKKIQWSKFKDQIDLRFEI